MTIGMQQCGTEPLEREIILPNGVGIRSEISHESKAGDDPVFRYVIAVGDRQKRMVDTESKELFEKIVDGAFEVFAKIFSNVELPNFIFVSALFSDKDRADEALSILTQFESQGVEFSPSETFFAALTVDKKFKMFARGNLTADDYFIDLVKSHNEMYESAIFDSVDEIWEFLDPWNMQLGLDNYPILVRSDLSIEDFIFLKAHPHMFDLYVKITTIWYDNRIPNECKMGDAKYVETLNAFEYNSYRVFKSLPFRHASLLDSVNELTRAEFTANIGSVPDDDSAEIVNEILQKNVASFRTEYNTDISQQCFLSGNKTSFKYSKCFPSHGGHDSFN